MLATGSSILRLIRFRANIFSSCGGSRVGWHEVERAFNDGVEHRVFPGATVIARRGDHIVFEGAFGFRTLIPEPRPMTIDTVFDLSSLTKVLATTIVVM